MSTATRLRVSVGLCALYAATVAAGALLAQKPGAEKSAADQAAAPGSLMTVGPNVQVSQSREKYAHYELLAGAHLADPNKLMACSMMISPEQNATNSVVYTSLDGGKTWSRSRNHGRP